MCETLMGGKCDHCPKEITTKFHLILEREGRPTRHFCSPICFIEAHCMEQGIVAGQA